MSGKSEKSEIFVCIDNASALDFALQTPLLAQTTTTTTQRSANEFHRRRRRRHRIDDVRRLRVRRRHPRRHLPGHARRADKVGGRIEARRRCPRDAGVPLCARRMHSYIFTPSVHSPMWHR
jgi:hypothetical protein